MCIVYVLLCRKNPVRPCPPLTFLLLEQTFSFQPGFLDLLCPLRISLARLSSQLPLHDQALLLQLLLHLRLFARQLPSAQRNRCGLGVGAYGVYDAACNIFLHKPLTHAPAHFHSCLPALFGLVLLQLLELVLSLHAPLLLLHLLLGYSLLVLPLLALLLLLRALDLQLQRR